MTVFSLPDLVLGPEDAQKVVDKHLSVDGCAVKVVDVKEVPSSKLSFVNDKKIYILDIERSANGHTLKQICFVTIASPNTSVSSSVGRIYTLSLKTIHNLLKRVHCHTSIPGSKTTLDTSRSTIPYDILLSAPVTVASATSQTQVVTSLSTHSPLLPAQTLHRVHVTLGTHLAELHTGVQNSWFGVPDLGERGGPNSTSWQETFVNLFESVVQFVKEKEAEAGVGFGRKRSVSVVVEDGLFMEEEDEGDKPLPYREMQLYMSRAIAFYLFDDIKVPSLVWLTGNEEDVYISAPTSEAAESHLPSTDAEVIAFLPSFSHALWGDPLLETLFKELCSPPSSRPPTLEGLMEGYTSTGSLPLISLSRHRTKRLWYTVYLCLVVLGESYSTLSPTAVPDLSGIALENAKWARRTVIRCIRALKDSPYH
ncbi:hypothetical protein BKA70DRAFT_1219709 [Coprinopsis sp. MPI-PUGE-AT-0042]|nr:hypothetical protein BKA70DRAFT_1219709 [Coprinopsis sp. MPI-PUGE-AT-0042]